MKRKGYIGLALLLIVIGTGIILLNSVGFQQRLVNKLTSSLTEKSGTTLTVGGASLNLFRGVVLKNVSLNDSTGATILTASRLEAGLRLLPLFRQRIEFHALRLIQPDVRLHRATPEAPLNIQPLLTAFSGDTTKKSHKHLRFSSVMIKNAHLRYDVLSAPELTTAIDPNHLKVVNLSALIRFTATTSPSYSLELVKLSADTLCCLPVKQLRFSLSMDGKHASLRHVQLKTPESQVDIPSLNLSYPSYQALTKLTDSLVVGTTVLRGRLLPAEWDFLNPLLTRATVPVDFSVSLQGTPDKWEVHKIRLNLTNMAQFEGQVTLGQVMQPDDLSINGNVSLFTVNAEGLTYFAGLLGGQQKSVIALQNLAPISYMGNLATKNHQLDIRGDFTSGIGNLTTNLLMSIGKNRPFKFKGQIASGGVDISRLLVQPGPLERLALDLKIEGVQRSRDGLTGSVEGLLPSLVIAGYTYQNLALGGVFTESGFEGNASLDDPNGYLDFSGLMHLSGDETRFHFDLLASGVNPVALKLLEQGRDANLAFKAKADLTGHKAEALQGELVINDLTFDNNGARLTLNELNAKSFKVDSSQVYVINSDVMDATVSGQFELGELKQSVTQLLAQYMPSAFPVATFKDPHLVSDIDLHVTLKPTPSLAEVLGVPLQYEHPIHLDGFYRHQAGRFRFKAVAPHLLYGNSLFQTVNLLVENPQQQLKLIANAKVGDEMDPMNLNMDARGMNDQATLALNWSNVAKETQAGAINAGLRFGRDEGGLSTLHTTIQPSDLVIRDTVWHVHPATIDVKQKNITVRNVQLSHRDEYIRIDGVASNRLNDTLYVAFNDFRLDDLVRLLPKNTMTFGGDITGVAACPHLFDKGTLVAELGVNRFSINDVVIGQLKASTVWNPTKKGLDLFGSVRSLPVEGKPDRQLAKAIGSFLPVSDSLILDIDAYKVSLQFLQPYLQTFIPAYTALGSGHVRVAGPLKKIGVETRAFVEDASLTVGFINTTYSFSDSIFVTPQYVAFRNVKVTDKEGNTGVVDGLLKHDYFKDMETQIDITVNRMMAMNLPATPNSLFYGTAYATGTVTISGPQNNTTIDVNVRTEDRTKVAISLMEASQDQDYNFIQFVNFNNRRLQERNLTSTARRGLRTQRSDDPTNLTVNLQIEATPSAELTLITDPNSGDEIKSRGTGAIRAVFNNENELSLFGRYTIDQGSYKFVYENLIRRDFSIVRGSNITFSGDPFAAQLDITANHTVDAQLADLISTAELASLNLTKNSIPVNCVLMLGGELQRPDIRLDLSYPSADDELVRRLKNVINTDEMLNQQLVYLLLFGRFNSPSTITTAGQSNMSSVLNTAISTLSSQFNSMLNSALGYSNLSFDVDYQNAAYELGMPGEFKVGVSGQWLDDRLTIQGNLGSRENLAQTGTSQFIGEFDLNLRMKNSQKWSWKLFNRANDNRYFKSALNTQGFGLVYNEEYNTLPELFRQLLEGLKKKPRKTTP